MCTILFIIREMRRITIEYGDSIKRYWRNMITECGDVTTVHRALWTPDAMLLLITANNPFVTV